MPMPYAEVSGRKVGVGSPLAHPEQGLSETEAAARLQRHGYNELASTKTRSVFAIAFGVAFVIGTIELIGVLADRLAITDGPLSTIANINLDEAGYGIVGLFVVLWLIALGVWRFGRVEERWSASPAE